MNPFQFALICLAVSSVSFLVGRATIFGPLRRRWSGYWFPKPPDSCFSSHTVMEWMEKNGKKRTETRGIISKFLDCPWCISVWVALAAALETRTGGFLFWWMAISGGSLLILGLMALALQALDRGPRE